MMINFFDKESIIGAVMFIVLIFFIVSSIYITPKGEPSKTPPAYIKYIYLVILSLPIFVALYNKNIALENMKLINMGKSLKCRDNQSLYLVAQNNGWRVDGIYFIKDSLLIRADKCNMD